MVFCYFVKSTSLYIVNHEFIVVNIFFWVFIFSYLSIPMFPCISFNINEKVKYESNFIFWESNFGTSLRFEISMKVFLSSKTIFTSSDSTTNTPHSSKEEDHFIGLLLVFFFFFVDSVLVFF